MWRWEFWVGALLCTASCALGSLESPELAWLLANESPPPLAAKRITPKSVFVAPSFTSCAEGYRQDALGRCIRIVKINEAAQWDFFLQKLNSMYAMPAKPPQKQQNTGPLRLPIPLDVFVGEPETTTVGTTTTEGTTSTTTMVSTIPPTTTEEEQTSTVVPTSTTVEDVTETPLLIIVANTTEPTTTSLETSTLTSAYTEPTEINEPETIEPATTIPPPPPTYPPPPPTYPPMRYASYNPVRFPVDRPTYEKPFYVIFPTSTYTNLRPSTWQQHWPPMRPRGHREPRPSWTSVNRG